MKSDARGVLLVSMTLLLPGATAQGQTDRDVPPRPAAIEEMPAEPAPDRSIAASRSGFDYLQEPAVLAELGLSDQQKQSIDLLVAEQRQELLALEEVDPEEVDTAAVTAVNDFFREKQAATLDEVQRRRLDEIQLQHRFRLWPAFAFAGPRVDDDVRLTDQQRKEIQNISDEATEIALQLAEQIQQGVPLSEVLDRYMEARRRDRTRSLAVLTDRQRAAMGLAFDLSHLPDRPIPSALIASSAKPADGSTRRIVRRGFSHQRAARFATHTRYYGRGEHRMRRFRRGAPRPLISSRNVARLVVWGAIFRGGRRR